MSPHHLVALLATAVLATLPVMSGSHQETIEVQVKVDVGHRLGKLNEAWRFFGADEPNYATMPNGGKLLGELGKLRPGNAFFRTHNLLTTGDGTPALKWGSTNAYTEDANGNPVYDWTILDGIFDAYKKHGLVPYAQVGFMPKALSTHPEPYQHHWHPGADYGEIYTGWAYPPKDYAKWGDLAYEWALHARERYGEDALSRWWWEVWNEPNIGYWQGTPEEFLRLHDYAVDGIRRALPHAHVGGPDVAGPGGRFMRTFLDHCLHGTNHATGQMGTPLDFVSFHAKGNPTVVDGHVRMGPGAQLRAVDQGFALISSYPQLKGIPVVIGESDPDGCAACQGTNLDYRNDTLYASYTAAVYARELELAERHHVNLQGVLTWAFTFENQAPFAGFRQLASNGVDLPILNLFRMLALMGGDQVSAESSGQRPVDEVIQHGVTGVGDVGVLASHRGRQTAVLLWHYHDDALPGPDAQVHVSLTGIPGRLVKVVEYRIDHDHSNAFTAWRAMGSPNPLSPEQVATLQEAAQLRPTGSPRTIETAQGIDVLMPRNSVVLLLVGPR